ncbi:MAG: DUF364 domain-containing protein [Calditrichota bacterium]
MTPEDALVHRIIDNFSAQAKYLRLARTAVGMKAVGVQLDDYSCGVAYRFGSGVTQDDSARISICPVRTPEGRGGLDSLPGRQADEILDYLLSENSLQRSIGLAVANCLASRSLSLKLSDSIEMNALKTVDGDVLSAIELDSDTRVAMIGYFEPLVPKLRDRCRLEIYELDTSRAPGLHESTEAFEGLLQCEVALITSTTIINGTIDKLLEASRNCREVVMLGPSTPLAPEVFKGTPVTLLSGVVILDENEAFKVISEGGSMRQLLPFARKINIRLI